MHESSLTFLTTAVIVLGVVLVFSLGVVLQVMLNSRERKLSIGSAARSGAAAVWAVPVLAVLALFAYRVVDAWNADDPARDRPRESATANAVDSPNSIGKPKLEPQEPAPDWADDAIVREPEGDRVQRIVLFSRAANVDLAERELAEKTQELLRTEYPEEFGGPLVGRISPAQFKRRVLARAPEVQNWRESVSLKLIDVDGEGPERTVVKDVSQTVPQVYWQLDLSPDRLEKLKQDVVEPRLWTLGAAAGLLALIFAATTLYFRLDSSTNGRYRFRLKLATTSLITAAGLLAAALIPRAS